METNGQVTETNDDAPAGLPGLTNINEKATNEEPKKKKKKKRSAVVTLIRIVVSLVIITVGIYLILFFVARAAKYDSIQAMVQSMLVELELMWQRIIY